MSLAVAAGGGAYCHRPSTKCADIVHVRRAARTPLLRSRFASRLSAVGCGAAGPHTGSMRTPRTPPRATSAGRRAGARGGWVVGAVPRDDDALQSMDSMRGRIGGDRRVRADRPAHSAQLRVGEIPADRYHDEQTSTWRSRGFWGLEARRWSDRHHPAVHPFVGRPRQFRHLQVIVVHGPCRADRRCAHDSQPVSDRRRVEVGMTSWRCSALRNTTSRSSSGATSIAAAPCRRRHPPDVAIHASLR